MLQTLRNFNFNFLYKVSGYYILRVIVVLCIAYFILNHFTAIGLNLILQIFWIVMWLISNMYNILLPACIISLSFAVVFFKNPIYSLLALIAVFFSMVIFLLSIKVEFLGMIFLIIYIGAISILFLFVIMMFNLKDIKAVKKSINFYISASLFNFVVIPKFYFVVCTHIQKHFLYNQIFINNISDLFNDPVNSVKYMQDILIISTSLYTKDAPVFIMLGYVLLAAMVGAIILALSSTSRLEKN